MSYFHLGREWDEMIAPERLNSVIRQLMAWKREEIIERLNRKSERLEADGFTTIYPKL